LQSVLVVQLIITNVSHIDALQAVNNAFYLATTFVLVACFFTLRKENFWDIPREQLLFEVFLLLVLLVSLTKVDIGAFKIILTDFVLLYFLMYGRKSITIDLKFINALFLGQICLELIFGMLGQNKYAFLPFMGQTVGYPWQVSLFPNGQTPLSGALSCIIVILNLYFPSKWKFPMIGFGSFFLLFSGSRTILIIAGLVAFMTLIVKFFPSLSARKVLLVTYTLPAVVIIFVIGFILLSSSGNAFVMEFLFRNFSNDEASFENLDRVLLLQTYWAQFIEHPVFGILSTTDFTTYADKGLKYVPTQGTETRLLYNLATFGISYLIFVVLIFYQQLVNLSKKNFLITSIWVFYLISNLLYGSYLRGYTFIGLLVFFILSGRISLNSKNEGNKQIIPQS
jgi:hypothetical protein